MRTGSDAHDDGLSWSDVHKAAAVASLAGAMGEIAEIASDEVSQSPGGIFGPATAIFEDLTAVLNKHDPDGSLRTRR